MNLKVTLNLLRFLSRLNIRPFGIVPESRTDGGGAQILAIMSIRAFCLAHGFDYFHRPINSIEHADEKNKASDWEKKFNLGYGASTVQNADRKIVKYKDLISNFFSLPNVLIEIPHAHFFCDHNIRVYEDIIPDFKRAYCGNLKIDHKHSHKINIAAHVRRGDVSESQNSMRYTDDHAIISRLVRIQKICRANDLQTDIKIYSEGQISDFQKFLSHDFELVLNDTPLDTLHELMTSDILLLAKSSFSYIAGLLSDGIVLYDDYWRQKKKSWISLRDGENFDDQLSQKIQELASSRKSR